MLKEVRVPLWKHETCEKALRAQFGNSYRLPLNNLCAGDEGNDACDVSRARSGEKFNLT